MKNKALSIIKNNFSAIKIAIATWLLTSAIFGIECILFQIIKVNESQVFLVMLIFPFALIASLPVLLILVISISWIKRQSFNLTNKYYRLFIVCFISTIPYAFIVGLIISNTNYFGKQLSIGNSLLVSTACFFLSYSLAILILNKKINNYFMEQNQSQLKEKLGSTANHQPVNSSNKILIKGIVTGALILLMLIPTVFVNNLVDERQSRQQEVVKEVKQGWATEQTVYGPYLFIPYQQKGKDINNKEIFVTKPLYLLPENLNLITVIAPEVRLRSIYKVLLYRSEIKTNGNFNVKLPDDFDMNCLQIKEAKICYGITDLKGIEEKVNINFNGHPYELSPGLPIKEFKPVTNVVNSNNEISKSLNSIDQREVVGLSSPVNLSLNDLQKQINFNINIKIKGSEQLHFIPLSGNSKFNVSSTWKNPKFDGNNLPSSRDITSKGFEAKWEFNKTNLPFGTVLNEFSFNKFNYAFGVTMLQPTDHYSKTSRSVKYAILFIGLTFALFFIIELLQNKPMHPVQYILIGISLVIFFTLLLSISEFLQFDFAYLIASVATILLIILYAKAHFKSIKTASIFGIFLTCLYAFIFVLIRLEDAALLVGSIGLFLILALTMYSSRKINWYNNIEE